MEEKWESIKKLIKNNEIDSVVELCNEMSTQEAQIVKDRLIQELRHTHEVGDRNTIAIILGDLKCDKAIDILCELILNPQNRNCRGSLIYALQELNCEHKLNQLLRILADSNYETKWNMYELLSERRKFMNEADKTDCIHTLREERDKLLETIDFIEDVLYNIFADES